MPEIGTSGLMSGDGKRGDAGRQYPRPSSTLPASACGGLLQSRRFIGTNITAPWDLRETVPSAFFSITINS